MSTALKLSPSPSASSASSSPSIFSDAHSTFEPSPYLDSARASSSTSLWTASSVSGSSEDMDMDAELRCLELLSELERQRDQQASGRPVPPMDRRSSGFQHVRDDSLPDVKPLDVAGARSARWAAQNEASSCVTPVFSTATFSTYIRLTLLCALVRSRRSTSNAPNAKSLAGSPSCATLRAFADQTPASSRRSRRLSFTRTDLAELDIDAILDAYTAEAAPTPPAGFRPVTPTRSLPRSKSSANLNHARREIFPSLPSAPQRSPSRRTGLSRTPTNRSSHSARSVATAASTTSNDPPYDELFPHRRVSPFPTVARKKSGGSLASRKHSFGQASAPPLPSLPPPPPPLPSSPSSHRIFTTFARPSLASSARPSTAPSARPSTASSVRPSTASSARPATASSVRPFAVSSVRPSTASSVRPSTASSAFSSFGPSSPPFNSRISYRSSTMSGAPSSAASSSGASFRWSVATSSTAPTVFSADGSDCAASRRGSLAPSCIGSIHSSPARRSSRRPSPPFPAFLSERDELEEEEQGAEDQGDDGKDDGGLISWEDFADELASLPVPPRPAPRRIASTNSFTSSRAGAAAPSTAPSSRPTTAASTSSSRPTTASSTRSHHPATLVFSPSAPSSAASSTAPFSRKQTASPFPSMASNVAQQAKKGLLGGLKMGGRSTPTVA
ncbi:hypothetical protein JCM1841_000684 [Sporobolomyces salmonicolor]